MLRRAAIVAGLAMASITTPALAILGYSDPPDAGWERLRWGSDPEQAAAALELPLAKLSEDPSPPKRPDDLTFPNRAYSLDYTWKGAPIRMTLLFQRQRRLWKVELSPRGSTNCSQLNRLVERELQRIKMTPEGRSTQVRERMRAYRGSHLRFVPAASAAVPCRAEIASNRERSRGF